MNNRSIYKAILGVSICVFIFISACIPFMQNPSQKTSSQNARPPKIKKDTEKWGFTPLHYAAIMGQNINISPLINQGIDINTMEPEMGWTPLACAVYNGHIKTAQKLIQKGADVNLADNYNWSPLHIAACKGNMVMTVLLLSENADINALTQNGLTPLDIATIQKTGRVAKILKSNGGVRIKDKKIAEAQAHILFYRSQINKSSNLTGKNRTAGYDPTVIAGGKGSCANYRFKFDVNGNVDMPYPVKVLNENTPIYNDESQSQVITRLSFNENIYIIEVGTDLVKVEFGGQFGDLEQGWIRKEALLCAYHPLKDENGMAIKFYPKSTYHFNKHNNEKVLAYPSLDLRECYEKCHPLSQPGTYFIFDEKPNSYLVGNYYRMGLTSNILGWVRKEDGVVYSVIGIRSLSDVCIYESISNFEDSLTCHTIKGGDAWFQTANRLLFVDENTDLKSTYYKVFIPDERHIITDDKLIGKFGYLKKSDKLERDLFITSNKLDKWIRFLDTIIRSAKKMNDPQLRNKFINALQKGIENIILKPIDGLEDVPIKDILQQHGQLPVRDDSPFLKYSLFAFKSSSRIPLCAIQEIYQWIKSIREILSIVRYGNLMPIFRTRASRSSCGLKNLPPRITEITSMYIEDDGFLKYKYQKTVIYWVPEKFMP